MNRLPLLSDKPWATAYRRRSRLVAFAGLALPCIMLNVPGWGRAGQLDGRGSRKIDFRQLLHDAGVGDVQFAPFQSWNGKLTADEGATVAQALFRLAQLGGMGLAEEGDAPRDVEHGKPGELAEVAGSVVTVQRVPLPEEIRGELRETGLYLSELQLAGGDVVVVLSARVPAAWLLNERKPLREPAALRGVVLGTVECDGESRPLVLTNRFTWRPVTGIPAGTAWLAKRGFDAALLDDVRHHQPFARPTESLEGAAFYSALQTMADGDAAELLSLARESVAAEGTRRQPIKEAAAARRRKLAAELADAPPQRKREIKRELKTLTHQESLAAHVQQRAAISLSSVAPMFAEPEESVGKFFVIEGTARRAVKIVVDQPSASSGADESPGTSGTTPTRFSEYYELDVFPNDSQNNPVICCVARLPKGFPTGDLIREPVRVAGVFFKRWSYARRTDAGAADDRPARVAPPLLLAAEPQWLRRQAENRDERSLQAGVALLCLGVIFWLALMRTSRRDRLARCRMARYDEPIDGPIDL